MANQLDPNGRVIQNLDPPPALDSTRSREGRNENSNMQTDETSELEKWKAIMIVMEKKMEGLENRLRNGVKKELDLSNQVDQNQNETGQGQWNKGTKGSNPNQGPIIFKKEDNRSRNDYPSNDSPEDDDNDDDHNDDHFNGGQKKKYINRKKRIEKQENESVVSRNNWIQDPALRLDSFIKINDKFSGKRSEDVVAWLAKLENNFIIFGIQEVNKTPFAVAMLAGGASTSYRNWCVKNQNITLTWNEFRKMMLEKYKQAEYDMALFNDLMTTKAGSQLDDYMEKYETFRSLVDITLDDVLRILYTLNLPKRIRDQLIQRKPKSLMKQRVYQ